MAVVIGGQGLPRLSNGKLDLEMFNQKPPFVNIKEKDLGTVLMNSAAWQARELGFNNMGIAYVEAAKSISLKNKPTIHKVGASAISGTAYQVFNDFIKNEGSTLTPYLQYDGNIKNFDTLFIWNPAGGEEL
ncbi:hypothetical protein VFDL14_13635 [Vibrio fortis]|uniref:Uncharacterized protein n=1 Tax=Vibrio fortis TaxID=212667 RepID=A0A066UQQ4_9VIBR|nr:hypothetical protein [Vibrio fortis]KDN29420.1 hypothetical protein VFDL14_13635 [Vibrio fortis]